MANTTKAPKGGGLMASFSFMLGSYNIARDFVIVRLPVIASDFVIVCLPALFSAEETIVIKTKTPELRS